MASNLLHLGPVRLPEDHPDALLATAVDEGADPRELAAAHPASSLAWAALAESALASGDAVAGYAYARTGYHRGLDALRRAGWKGAGQVPWAHPANRGVLRAIHALSRAAGAIGEDGEATRCAELLAECDPQAVEQLSGD